MIIARFDKWEPWAVLAQGWSGVCRKEFPLKSLFIYMVAEPGGRGYWVLGVQQTLELRNSSR